MRNLSKLTNQRLIPAMYHYSTIIQEKSHYIIYRKGTNFFNDRGLNRTKFNVATTNAEKDKLFWLLLTKTSSGRIN